MAHRYYILRLYTPRNQTITPRLSTARLFPLIPDAPKLSAAADFTSFPTNQNNLSLKYTIPNTSL